MRISRTLFVLAASTLSGLALQSLAADTDPADTLPPQQMQGSQLQGMGEVIELPAVTTTFTVQNVDKDKRTVTLKATDGSMQTVHCGPQVRNFDQIKQGDQVRATVIDEIGVAIRPGGQPQMGETQSIAVAPKGAKPAMVMIQTREVTATILAVDPDKRMVSLQGPSGADRTIKVGPKVDLSQIKKGDSITLQVAQGMMIAVQSPEGSAQPAGGSVPSGEQSDDMQPKESGGKQ